MNKYLKNLEKIEFVITYACTGRCKHCSEGDHCDAGVHIDPTVAGDAVRRIAEHFDIKTVMAFGGEPLLYPEAVYSIMKAAYEMGVPKRQVITNGYFSRAEMRIKEVASELARCSVNDLLLSVDAFHQETIPIDAVEFFALEAQRAGIPIRVQPAWLVKKEHDNPYNAKTSELLRKMSSLGIAANEGNIIFPEGNALRYLGEYFEGNVPENPYIEDPENLKCLSFEPSGNILGDNIYKRNILEILKNYRGI